MHSKGGSGQHQLVMTTSGSRHGPGHQLHVSDWPIAQDLASRAHCGEVAQLVEHTTENRGVAGSIPALAITTNGLDDGFALAITSVLAFGALFGLIGAIIAVPIAAAIQIVAGELTAGRRARIAAADATEQQPA